MRKLRMLSLCAGIGGADLAAEWTGQIAIAGQVEIDPYCVAVLAKHWPGVPRMHDIREVRGDEFGEIDLVVGGIPCQPFSSAGKQLGTADDRYLWPEMFRIVQRCHPTWILIENVDDFVNMAFDLVAADLEAAHYTVQAFVLPAGAIGAPHERQRCFAVAYAGCYRRGIGTREQEPRSASVGRSNACAPRAEESDEALANPSSAGWQERDAPPEPGNTRHAAWRNLAPGTPLANTEYGRREGWSIDPNQSDTTLLRGSPDTRPATQPRLGGATHGVPSGMDRDWPAGQYAQQKDWESPRIVTSSSKGRNQRLKALGNAIVPQQVYPIFEAIIQTEHRFEA